MTCPTRKHSTIHRTCIAKRANVSGRLRLGASNAFACHSTFPDHFLCVLLTANKQLEEILRWPNGYQPLWSLRHPQGSLGSELDPGTPCGLFLVRGPQAFALSKRACIECIRCTVAVQWFWVGVKIGRLSGCFKEEKQTQADKSGRQRIAIFKRRCLEAITFSRITK